MKDITEADYAAGIPKCCSRQTYQEHADMLLCWGLMRALENEKIMNCNGCELKNPAIPCLHVPQPEEHSLVSK